MKLVGDLAQCPDHFRMTGVTDEDQIVSLRIVAIYFVMDFDHQRAGRINHMETTLIRFLPDGLRHAMCAENDDRPFRDFVQLFHKDSALLPERIHHMTAVNDLVTYIDGSAVLLERQIHDIDRPIDTGTKPTGIGEIDLHSRRSSLGQCSTRSCCRRSVTIRQINEPRQPNCPIALSFQRSINDETCKIFGRTMGAFARTFPRSSSAEPEPQSQWSLLRETAFGFWGSKVLLTAVEVGLFTTLAGRRLTGAELGKALHFIHVLIPIFLTRSWRWNFSTATVTVLRRSISTAEGSLFLNASSPRYIGGILIMLNARQVYYYFAPIILCADFRRWCSEVGFTRFEVMHWPGHRATAIAYK